MSVYRTLSLVTLVALPLPLLVGCETSDMEGDAVFVADGENPALFLRINGTKVRVAVEYDPPMGFPPGTPPGTKATFQHKVTSYLTIDSQGDPVLSVSHAPRIQTNGVSHIRVGWAVTANDEKRPGFVWQAKNEDVPYTSFKTSVPRTGVWQNLTLAPKQIENIGTGHDALSESGGYGFTFTLQGAHPKAQSSREDLVTNAVNIIPIPRGDIWYQACTGDVCYFDGQNLGGAMEILLPIELTR